MSEDGRLLLDFYTHVDNFTKTASPETQAEVLQFLKSDRFSDKKDGIAVFWVSPPRHARTC